LPFGDGGKACEHCGTMGAQRRSPIGPAVALAALCIGGTLANAAERTDAATAALLAEVRHSFTLHGKPIPPEIFRDFGDGDLADSGGIWVTVDLDAAVGSNLYYDDIKADGRSAMQKKTGTDEETGYDYVGSTDNGLLVAVANYSGGGSGDFITLHIMDLAAARGFDNDGKVYTRINLTNLRSMALGDRWAGDVSIAKNTIHVVTTRSGPANDAPKKAPMTIEAKRP
jgi:hypothetical protein